MCLCVKKSAIVFELFLKAQSLCVCSSPLNPFDLYVFLGGGVHCGTFSACIFVSFYRDILYVHALLCMQLL